MVLISLILRFNSLQVSFISKHKDENLSRAKTQRRKENQGPILMRFCAKQFLILPYQRS